MTRRNSLKIAHPWLTFKYGDGHSYQNWKRSWSLFSCSVIYFVITPVRLFRLHPNYIGTRGCIGRGLHFSCTRQDLFFGQYHTISIFSFHKSGINIISIFQHSSITTTIISVLAPQHVIFYEFPSVHFLPPTLTCCSSFLAVLTHIVFNFCYS